MDYDLECSGFNVRQFLARVSTHGELGELGNDVMTDILAAVDDIETDTDAILDADNEPGWDSFQTKISVRSAAHSARQLEPAFSYMTTWVPRSAIM